MPVVPVNRQNPMIKKWDEQKTLQKSIKSRESATKGAMVGGIPGAILALVRFFKPSLLPWDASMDVAVCTILAGLGARIGAFTETYKKDEEKFKTPYDMRAGFWTKVKKAIAEKKAKEETK